LASALSCTLKNAVRKGSGLFFSIIKKTRVKFTTEGTIVEWEEGICFWILLENAPDMVLTKVIQMTDDEIEDLHPLAVVDRHQDVTFAANHLLEIDTMNEIFTEEKSRGAT